MTKPTEAPQGGFNFDLAKRNAYLEVRRSAGSAVVKLHTVCDPCAGRESNRLTIAGIHNTGKGREVAWLHKDRHNHRRHHLQGAHRDMLFCSDTCRTVLHVCLMKPVHDPWSSALQDGVVLGADTRSTAGTTVADKNCEKIHYIAPNIYCCGAGTAADTENVTGAE